MLYGLFQVIGLKEFLTAMEDAGEIVTFMAHQKEQDMLQCVEKVVFVMDPLKHNGKKRRMSKAAWTSNSLCLHVLPVHRCACVVVLCC